jgi:hypothetical protein
MKRSQTGFLVMLLVAGMWGGTATAQTRHERTDGEPAPRTRVAADGNGSIQQAAGSFTLLEPGQNGQEHELDAAVWMSLKDVRGAACFSFDVIETETDLTITAYCFAGKDKDKGKGNNKAWGSFEVEAIVWDGNSGQGETICQQRQNLRRNPVFACTVPRPFPPQPAP